MHIVHSMAVSKNDIAAIRGLWRSLHRIRLGWAVPKSLCFVHENTSSIMATEAEFLGEAKKLNRPPWVDISGGVEDPWWSKFFPSPTLQRRRTAGVVSAR